jgi:predicted AlkP superfamily pyrophosphatase or phosphodiesterase
VRSVGVLLVDGLGYHALPVAAKRSPVLADILAGRLAGASVRPITTGFPSTTPTSVVSLGTGAAPGAHGLVGFFLNIPGTDTVLNHIQWGDEPDPLRWQPLGTQFDRAARAGIFARVVGRPEFRGTGLTSAAYRGAEFVESTDVDSLAARMLEGMSRRPSIVYGYLPDVDKAGHRYGNNSPQWMDAAADVDRLLTLLIDGLTPGSALVLTADHGQLDIPADRRFDLDVDQRLRAGVRVVAGEPRVRYLHTCPGRPTTCWPPGPTCSATGPGCSGATRPWPRGCSAPSPTSTCDASETWSPSAARTMWCWPPGPNPPRSPP